MEQLIFDRTLNDVTTALNNQGNLNFLKGAYNYTDLNRVETWGKYIQDYLTDYGFNSNLIWKINWTLTDFPVKTEIDRIRNNIDTLKNFFISLSTDNIVYNNTFNYEQANILEKILYDINKLFIDICQKLNLKYDIGAFIIYRKYITLKGE